MGYRIPYDTLEGVIKQLEANNKLLASLQPTPALNSTNVKINKMIKANEKQITIIKEAAPYELDLYAVEKKKK